MQTPLRPPPMPGPAVNNVIPLRREEAFMRNVQDAIRAHFDTPLPHDKATTIELEAGVLVALLGTCEGTADHPHYDRVLDIVGQACQRMRDHRTNAVGLALYQLAEIHAERLKREEAER